MRPATDPELLTLLFDLPLVSRLTPEVLAEMRRMPSVPIDAVLAGRPIDHQVVTAPASDGTPLPLSIFTPAERATSTGAPLIYWIHGGGMVMGDRFANIDIPLEWLTRFDATVVSVNYRLAPAEVFRDEDVAYANRIWAAGGQAELHVWAGGFHGFDALYPHAKVSAAARRTRTGWLGRVLSGGPS